MARSFFKSVAAAGGSRLNIEMTSGSTIILDLSSKLETVRFWPLNDPQVFGDVAIDGDFLVFGGKVRISANEVRDIAMLPHSLE